MKLFAYNEKSILNNSFVRTINFIIFLILLILALCNVGYVQLQFFMIVLIPLISSILSSFIIDKTLRNTEFFEWDYTERCKKFRFTIIYGMICFIICSMFIFSVVISYNVFKSEDIELMGRLISILPNIFLCFQIPNIVNLYYPVFEDDLTIAYKIQKKPDNWQDKGKEINDDDEISEIMHRDFGI